MKNKKITLFLFSALLVGIYASAPVAIGAADCPAGATCFTNPLKYGSASEVLSGLMTALQGIVAVIAIIMIVIGGLIYMFAGVNEKNVDLAKKMIGGAVIGLAIIVAAPSFLKELLSILSSDCVSKCGVDEACKAACAPIDAAPSIQDIAKKFLNLLLSIVGIVATISLVIGGIYYMTAYGDEDRIDTGKKILTYSIIGIAVALASLIIVNQVAVLFAP